MTFGDRAYGALAGGIAGFEMGKAAFGLTRYEIKRQFDRITEIAEGAEKGGDPQAEAAFKEAVVLAKTLIRDGRFDANAYKKDLEEAGIAPAENSGATGADLFKAVLIGMKYTYDIPTCIDAAAQMMEMKDRSSAALAGACAIAAASAAAVEGNSSRDDVMQLAFDSAVFGERRGARGCGPSVSRRIKLAKKLIDDAKVTDLKYLTGELTAVFGSEGSVYESVPLVMGIFYAVEGNAKKAVIEAVNAGGAADTNAALCGAVCGGFSGINTVPVDWSSRAGELVDADIKDAAHKLARRV